MTRTLWQDICVGAIAAALVLILLFGTNILGS
jgi:hypothetical protein